MSVLIIADIGSNHMGDLDRAVTMIRECQWAGVDVAKFQAVSADAYVNEEEWLKRKDFALTTEQLKRAAEACERSQIEFMVTPTLPSHVHELDPYVKRWKLASADIHNSDLISAIQSTRKPLIYSQGVASGGLPGIPLMCVAKYPSDVQDYPLGLKSNQGPEPIPWGLSDHTLGIHLPIAAVALGACIIEKHLRLWHQPPSPDSGHSIHPGKMKQMVEQIRELEQALVNTTQPDGRRALLAKGRKVSQ